jgi:predicted alpha-1,2-mannosidase
MCIDPRPAVAALALLALGLGCEEPGVPRLDTTPPVDHVDPFIGSGGKYFAYGSAFVGPSRPFGLAKPGPDTVGDRGMVDFHHFSGYHPDDSLLHGFSQVHISGTGAVDYGALLLQPSSGFGPEKVRESGYRARMDKVSEEASPGYYAVSLSDLGVRAELTATERVAVYRFTFRPQEPEPVLILDASHALPNCRVEDSRVSVSPDGREASGFVHYRGALTGRSGGFRLYFLLRLSEAPAGWTAFEDDQLRGQLHEVRGPEAGLAFRFGSLAAPVEVRIGLSYVDEEGARRNLEAETTGRDFEALREDARASWNEHLGRVRIAGGSPDERRMFYTALYHALLHPTRFQDVDGRYTGFDLQVHQAEGFTYYTDFSLWDTYRAPHPLYTLLWPELQRDLLHSLLAMKAQGGFLPRWPAATGYTGCMIGTPADVVFADSYLKGVTDFDVETAYQAVVENATRPLPRLGRPNVLRYLELGYLPADEEDGSAAKTLEYGVADGAIASWAEALGKAQDAADFRARSQGYRHLWDPDTRFLRGKNADGSWPEGEAEFNPLDWNAPYYVEGDAWQYSWLAPHDPAGLVALFPSPEAFVEKLTAFFATPEPDDPLAEFLPKRYYWHGNEPDIHAAYLFVDAGRPDLTQRWVRHVLSTEYGTGTDGLPGNDDLGTMSAWYVFSASGFYPSAGQDWYWLGSPLFERVVFEPAPGLRFEVRALGASAERLYVRSAHLNGRPLPEARFSHRDIALGGRLELDMSDAPGGWDL